MNHELPERSTSIDESALVATQSWLEQNARIFPSQCAWAAQRYDQSVGSLPEVTNAELGNAVEKRRREFSAGRVAASTALKKLGSDNPVILIPIGAGRNPIWPHGFVGSITHNSGLAIAATARDGSLASIGLDLELTNAVQSELWPSILRASEIDFVSNKPLPDRSRWATILFSAKESFYKMQYPLTHEWVDFQDAEISISELEGDFELLCTQAAVVHKLQRSRFPGRYLSGPKFSLTVMHCFPKK